MLLNANKNENYIFCLYVIDVIESCMSNLTTYLCS